MSAEGSRALDDDMRLWLNHLRVERGVARNTMLSYTRDLRRYRDFLTRRRISDMAAVTQDDVTAFLMDLRAGGEGHPPLSAASAARSLVAVRGLHRFLHAEGVVPTNPGADVAPPRPVQRLPKAISQAEVGRLLAAASVGEGPISQRDRALLELLYGSGARISEVVGLDVDDIDVEAGAVRLQGKGGKERVVPLGQFARDALSVYLREARQHLAKAGADGGAAVFLNQRGGRLSRQSAWALLQNAAERAGVKNTVSPHTLRHSFATHMLEGGADVRVVQELLGHASVATTQIYTLITVQHLREVYAQTHPRAR